MKSTLAALAIAFVVTSVIYMPVCNLVFDCGCTWPWLGGVQHCNIHVAGPPDCPLCTSGYLVQAGFFALIAAPLRLLASTSASLNSGIHAGSRARFCRM